MADRTPERIRKEKELELLRLQNQPTPAPQAGASDFEVMAAGSPLGASLEAVPDVSMGDFPVGAAIGGTIGAFAGGGTPASIPLAGLGAAGGEAVEQNIRHGLQALGFDVTAPETSLEAAKKIGVEGLLGLAGEGIGQVGIRGTAALGRKIAPKLRPDVEAVSEAVQPFFPKAKLGFRPISRLVGATKQPALLPAQLTESPLLDTIQEVSKRSFLGGGGIIKAQQLTDDVVSGLVTDFTKNLRGNTGRLEVGELVFNALDEGIDAFSASGTALYNTVDDLTRAQFTTGLGEQLTVTKKLTNGVDLTSAKKTARSLLSQAQKGIRTKEQTTVLNEIINKPDLVSFSDAHILRSDLLKIARSGSELVKGKAQGVAKAVGKPIDNAMNQAAKDLSGDALNAWREANKFWKSGKNTFNSRFVRGLASADPEVALERVLQSGKPSNIIKLRKVIDDPIVWKKIQGEFVNKLQRTAITDEISGTLSGKALLRNIRTAGDDMFRAIAPNGELNNFKKFSEALALNQAKQPGGGGATVFIALAQAGAAGKIIFTGDADVGSLTILGGPFLLSKILTSPGASKILLEGFKASGSQKSLVTLATRLGAILTKEEIDARFDLGGQEVETP